MDIKSSENQILKIKQALLDFSNIYLQLITLIQNDVAYVKMDILANYYKSSIFCLKKLINQPSPNHAKSARSKIDRLYKEIIFLRFSIDKNDKEFEKFKEKTLKLIDEIKNFE